jgi:hypothetical protein
MSAVPAIRIPLIRVTSDGSWRVTSDGAVRIVGYLTEAAVASLIDVYFPGIVVQRNLTEATTQWLIDHDGLFFDTDVPAILALANSLLDDDVVSPYVPTTQDHYPLALPPYPTGLPRFPDSNPAPDGWSIVDNGMVVRGGGP